MQQFNKFEAIKIFLFACLMAVAESATAQQSVTIGTQTWMTTNLDVATYSNGDTIPHVTDQVQWSNLTTGAWCYYNNDPILGAVYGKLYNWYAVNDPRGLSPIGWHIPTSDEWTTLIDYLGGYDVAGGKMKESGTAHWIPPNIDADNNSGFSALPSGSWTNLVGRFSYLGSAGFWWGSTPVNETSSTIVGLYNDVGSIGMSNGINNYGASVRCIRDNCPLPVIQCSGDTVINAVGDHCGIVVKYNPPLAKDACGTSTIEQITGLASGAFFPVGVTINKFVATSASGLKDTCSFTITVKDTRPPFIKPVWAFPSVLWPTDHKMQKVFVAYYAWDNCGSVSCSLDVSSNEAASGNSTDWVILDDHHVKLRAERSERGDGRIYTITVTCTDEAGNISTQNTKVYVPLIQHRHYSKGGYYDSWLDCRILPNPSSSYFEMQINSSSDENIELNLYDIAGRFLSRLNAVNNQTIRFGGDLRPGVFMVEVRQGQQRQTMKVVKQ